MINFSSFTRLPYYLYSGTFWFLSKILKLWPQFSRVRSDRLRMIYFLSYSYPLSSLVESYFSFKDFAAFHFKIKSRCCVYQKLLINGMVQIKVASYLSWFDLEIFVLRQVCQAKRTYHVVLSTFVFSLRKNHNQVSGNNIIT